MSIKKSLDMNGAKSVGEKRRSIKLLVSQGALKVRKLADTDFSYTTLESVIAKNVTSTKEKKRREQMMNWKK